MTNESTATPPPEANKPPAEGTDRVDATGTTEDDPPRKPFVMRFPRAPIPGTEHAVRAPSFGQHSETAADSRNDELSDRAFVARLVTRQLDTDVPADEVEAWPDERLIAAGQGYLSLIAREPSQGDDDDDDGSTGETEGEEAAPIDEPDTSTFAGIRTAIRRDDERRNRRMRRLFEGIGGLADRNAAMFTDLVKIKPDISKAMDPFKGLDIAKLSGADTFRNLGMAKSLDAFKGIDLAQLSGTSKIAESIAKLTADTSAMEQFAGAKLKLPQILTPIAREPMTYIGPLVNPEVRLLEEVTETLERMHDDELRTSEGQIEVLVEVTTLLKKQGLALEILVNDARGQKWPRRAILATAVIAAVAAVLAVAYSAGILRPFDAASPVLAPSIAPIVSPSIAPSVTPASSATLSPSSPPSASPAVPSGRATP